MYSTYLGLIGHLQVYKLMLLLLVLLSVGAETTHVFSFYLQRVVRALRVVRV
jgi:hypothetical protein